MAPNRREFLKNAVMTGAGALAWATSRPSFGFARNADLDPSLIRKLGTKFNGRIIAPGDQEYEEARRVSFWNPRTDRRPALIARCESEDDVARAIEFAQRHQLPIAVRGGGHSYLGWGS